MENIFEDADKKEKNDSMEMPSTKISDTIFANMRKCAHEEYQYLNIVENILEDGVWEEGRNGNTKSVFGRSMRFSLADGKIPILTTKKTAWKTCLKELLWFIRGETHNSLLKEQGVHIWDANGTRKFLDSRGLSHYDVDELGPIYGYQWRNFDRKYYCRAELERMDSDTISQLTKQGGVDQLQQIIDTLNNPTERTSRRLVMTAWNPNQLHQMALPPCHVLCQFNVHDGNKLSCALYQRSGDFPLGVPINIASYSFLTHLVAKHCGLEAFEFVHFVGNCHIYEDHILPIQQQILRDPVEFPTVNIKHKRGNINDYCVDDFEICNYTCHAPIVMKMVA